MGRWQVQNYLDKKESGTLPRLILPRSTLVDGAWQGETAFVIGGGPSVVRQIDQLADAGRMGRIVTINMGFRLTDRPSLAYFGSILLLMKLQGDQGFGRCPNKVALDAMLWNVRHNYGCGGIPALAPELGWSHALADGLPVLSNSGAVVLNLLDLLGCRRIVLLGFDLHPSKGGQTINWHNEYPGYMRPQESPYGTYLRDFEYAEQNARAEILNTNPDSALMAFPHRPLEDILDEARDLQASDQ